MVDYYVFYENIRKENKKEDSNKLQGEFADYLYWFLKYCEINIILKGIKDSCLLF